MNTQPFYGRFFWALSVAVALAGISDPAWAAVEAEYTETDIEMPRDSSGVSLSAQGGSHRDIPDDRKMKQIVSNVVKAEEKDAYISRSLDQIRTEMNRKIDKLDQRMAALESQLIAMKSWRIKNERPVQKPPASQTKEPSEAAVPPQDARTKIL